MAKAKHRGGYPRRVANERATERVIVRVTPTEQRKLQEATEASGERSMSDFVRAAIAHRAKRYGVDL